MRCNVCSAPASSHHRSPQTDLQSSSRSIYRARSAVPVMASPRKVAIGALVFLAFVASSSPLVVRARTMPADDGGQERMSGVIAANADSATTASSSTQQDQRPPPLPLLMSPPTKTTFSSVFTRRSSSTRMLDSVPSPGVGH